VRAAPGDIVKGDTALQTGGYSRAELQFPDLTITRVGSNALFRFIAGTREMVLDSGTMLFSSPKGAGGGKVQAGAITAAVTGSDFLISNAGRVKVICLSHKVAVYFTANPKVRVELLPGQMLDIAAGDRLFSPAARHAEERADDAGDFESTESHRTHRIFATAGCAKGSQHRYRKAERKAIQYVDRGGEGGRLNRMCGLRGRWGS
jgi:hypothetical protein